MVAAGRYRCQRSISECAGSSGKSTPVLLAEPVRNAVDAERDVADRIEYQLVADCTAVIRG
jgi:hypothetical protein